MVQKKVDGKMKSAHARRLSINKYLLPAIGKLKIEAVQPRHIIAMLEKTKEIAPTTANDLLAWSKQMLNYAIKQQIITNNPVAAFSAKEDAGGTEYGRIRYLSHRELTLLFDAMRRADKFTNHHYQAVKLLMLLGCRKSERCLNHKISGMAGVYDRGDYFAERRQALEKWAAFLQTAEDGTAWNVTPIRKDL